MIAGDWSHLLPLFSVIQLFIMREMNRKGMHVITYAPDVLLSTFLWLSLVADVDYVLAHSRRLEPEDVYILVVIFSAFFRQNNIGFTSSSFNTSWFLNNISSIYI